MFNIFKKKPRGLAAAQDLPQGVSSNESYMNDRINDLEKKMSALEKHLNICINRPYDYEVSQRLGPKTEGTTMGMAQKVK